MGGCWSYFSQYIKIKYSVLMVLGFLDRINFRDFVLILVEKHFLENSQNTVSYLKKKVKQNRSV